MICLRVSGSAYPSICGPAVKELIRCHSVSKSAGNPPCSTLGHSIRLTTVDGESMFLLSRRFRRLFRQISFQRKRTSGNDGEENKALCRNWHSGFGGRVLCCRGRPVAGFGRGPRANNEDR